MGCPGRRAGAPVSRGAGWAWAQGPPRTRSARPPRRRPRRQPVSAFPGEPPRFASLEACAGLGRGRLPGRRVHHRGGVPRRPPVQAGPGGGTRRHGQDAAGQVGGRADRRPPHPPPVLRGAGRVQGALRVELPQAAPADSGRRTRRSRAAAPAPAVRGRGAPQPSWKELEEDIFSEEFLLARPLLEAIRSTEPVVLLIDEVDRVELETEALLLEILSEYQVSIPELGTVRATRLPDGLFDLEQHPGALRGPQAALPVPAHRLPRPRT